MKTFGVSSHMLSKIAAARNIYCGVLSIRQHFGWVFNKASAIDLRTFVDGQWLTDITYILCEVRKERQTAVFTHRRIDVTISFPFLKQRFTRSRCETIEKLPLNTSKEFFYTREHFLALTRYAREYCVTQAIDRQPVYI